MVINASVRGVGYSPK